MEEKTINTMIRFRDMAEYYRYKDRPIQDIIDLMKERHNELIDRKEISCQINKELRSKSTQDIIRKTMTTAIEDSLRWG